MQSDTTPPTPPTAACLRTADGSLIRDDELLALAIDGRWPAADLAAMYALLRDVRAYQIQKARAALVNLYHEVDGVSVQLNADGSMDVYRRGTGTKYSALETAALRVIFAMPDIQRQIDTAAIHNAYEGDAGAMQAEYIDKTTYSTKSTGNAA